MRARFTFHFFLFFLNQIYWLDVNRALIWEFEQVATARNGPEIQCVRGSGNSLNFSWAFAVSWEVGQAGQLESEFTWSKRTGLHMSSLFTWRCRHLNQTSQSHWKAEWMHFPFVNSWNLKMQVIWLVLLFTISRLDLTVFLRTGTYGPPVTISIHKTKKHCLINLPIEIVFVF